MRILRPMLLGCLLVLLLPTAAAAHPLDQIYHDLRVQIRPDQLNLEVHLILGPLVTPRLWTSLDADGSQTLDDAEITAWCQRYLNNLALRFDDASLPSLALGQIDQFPRDRTSFIGDGTTNLHWTAHAPVPTLQPGEHMLTLFNAAYPDISAYDWSKTRGFQGIVVREALQMSAGTAVFPVRWPAEFAASAASSAPAAPAATAAPSTAAPAALIARLKSDDWSVGFMLVSLLSALLFGALHALQPGHGKTLVAAYLVGSRGTLRHAVLLGVVVTFTHTVSVLGLGVLLLIFSRWVRPEQIIPGLTLASGMLVVGIGLNLLLQRVRLARAGRVAHTHHHHGFGGQHHHHHDHAHDHAHHHEHAPLSRRGIVSLGISGGLVPCPEALVILILAATWGRLALGLALIVAFSLGLALVLIAIGMLLVLSGEQLWRRFKPNGAIPRWLPVLSALIVVGLGLALALQGLARIV